MASVVQLTLALPDLVRESMRRAALATRARHDAFGNEPVPYAGAVPCPEPVTGGRADLRGLDPVVFGAEPRVRDGRL